MTERTCGRCGIPLVRRSDERDGHWATRVYCSRRCTASKPSSTNPHTGRARANRLFPGYQPCAVCGKEYTGLGTVHRHHRDGNPLNNVPENVAFLCAKHHKDAHRALTGRVGGGPRPRVAKARRDAAIAWWQRALPLRDAGLRHEDIAEQLGFSRSTVSRWFRKYEKGLPR